MKRRSVPKGIISALGSFFFLAMVGLCVKLAVSYGGNVWWVVFIQYSTVALIALVFGLRYRFKNLKSGNYKLEILRAVVGMSSFLCFSFTLTRIPLVDASLLQNSAPLFIPLISFLWLKKTIETKIWYGVITGFIGIVFIIKPDSSVFNVPAIVGLASGLLLAIAYLVMNVLTRYDDFKTILMYYSLTAFLITLPGGIFYSSLGDIHIWMFAVGAGIAFIGYLNLQQFAYKHIEANRLSPFNYSVVIFTGFADWLVFGNSPDLMTITGIILVISGGVFTIYHHEKGKTGLRHSWH